MYLTKKQWFYLKIKVKQCFIVSKFKTKQWFFLKLRQNSVLIVVSCNVSFGIRNWSKTGLNWSQLVPKPALILMRHENPVFYTKFRTKQLFSCMPEGELCPRQ